jgi:hypothetical protein
MALPIVMYGSYTCEDTAVTRDRLRTLRVPFKESMLEEDAQVSPILVKYSQGLSTTPTLVFGEDEIVIAEPSIEQLEEALTKAGYTFEARHAHALPAKKHAPDLTALPTFSAGLGIAASDAQLSQWVVVFAHTPACRVCQGYAKQIAAQLQNIRKLDADLRIVLQADLKSAEQWSKKFAPGVAVIADADAAAKREYADFLPDSLDVRLGGTWLVILDRDEIPRIGQYSPDAGGLISATQIIQQLTKAEK